MSRAPALLVSLSLLAGCTGASGRSPAASSPSATATPSTGRTVLPAIVLRASAKERVRRWRRVAFIPFGPRTSDLGFHVVGDLAPSEPYSFAIAPDGSFWVADRWKRRLAHYSSGGGFLGAVPVSPSASGWLHDMEFVGATLYAETNEQLGHMVAMGADQRVRLFSATSAGRSIFTEGFYPTPAGLVSSTPGTTESMLGTGPQEGPFGYVRIDPGTGAVTPLDGLPLGDGSSFSSEESSAGTFDVAFAAPGHLAVQPLSIEYSRDGRHTTPSSGGPGEFTVVGHDVLAFVSISAARPRNDLDGGRWLLRLGRSPLLWERLPMPTDGFDDSVQRRHIAVGPDGSIYLMLAGRGGELILRRP